VSTGAISPLLAAADELHDIAPAIDYSLIPTWAVFLVAFVTLSLVGGIIWWIIARRKRRVVPPQLPRDRALAALERAEADVERIPPYQFSIRVSDILRSYVTDQYGLPVTRQTSVEFLEGLRRRGEFLPEDKSLLEDFLNRCDLIKFARYDATAADSRLLLDEAKRFVRGGELVVPALV
jgi:hypothetical protein